jgi:outer membrane lipoprotein-sorting protein
MSDKFDYKIQEIIFMRIMQLFIVIVLITGCTFAQGPVKTPPAGEILDRVVKGFSGVQDFSVSVEAEVKMERFQAPKMIAAIFFKRPDKIHVASEGFFFIPREGIDLNPAVLQERYDASFGKDDTINGQKVYKLQLAAKETKTRLRQLYVWVDPSNWTIAKIETIPYEGRTLSMSFNYEYLQEKFWLPSRLVASFGSTTEAEKQSGDSVSQINGQFEQRQHGLPRNGSVTIQYSNYKVNTGIDDSVFEDKKQ